MEIYKASRTDAELVASLQSWFRLKGDYAILEAAKRLQTLSHVSAEILAALQSTRDGLQAMADEGIVAQGSWPTIDAAIAKAIEATEQ